MFQRIRQYDLIQHEERWFRPRAYGEVNSDGTWEGWLVFFPLAGRPAIATERETTQTTYNAIVDWSAGLTSTYLEGALDRALTLEARPPITAQLAAAEYEALEDASLLDSAAEGEQALADAARAEADALHEERLATEEAIAAVEETDARLQVAVHERAAKEARAVAADASDKRRATARSNRPKRVVRSRNPSKGETQ
jgi:hypothetical protein